MECKKTNCVLEAHHITPRRLKGSNTISNLITLCSNCHDKTEGKEELFINKYESMINGKSIRFDYAQHVMQGKSYLRNELSKLGNLILTTEGKILKRYGFKSLELIWRFNKIYCF